MLYGLWGLGFLPSYIIPAFTIPCIRLLGLLFGVEPRQELPEQGLQPSKLVLWDWKRTVKCCVHVLQIEKPDPDVFSWWQTWWPPWLHEPSSKGSCSPPSWAVQSWLSEVSQAFPSAISCTWWSPLPAWLLSCNILVCTWWRLVPFWLRTLLSGLLWPIMGSQQPASKPHILYCIVLYCIVLYCIVLYCIVLYCIVFCLSVLSAK